MSISPTHSNLRLDGIVGASGALRRTSVSASCEEHPAVRFAGNVHGKERHCRFEHPTSRCGT